MITVTVIGGVPGTGKTMLMREIITRLGMGFDSALGLVKYSQYPKARAIVLGDYTDPAQVFAGTDRLSMGVQPEALAFITDFAHTHGNDGARVLLEGDRLFNLSFLKALSGAPDIHLRVMVLAVKAKTLQLRYAQRNSQQSEVFLKGRVTKVRNILDAFTETALMERHETREDTKRLADKVLDLETW